MGQRADPRYAASRNSERLVRDAEVAGSNPVAPTIFRNEPFGQQVEGLSHCGDKSCVFERKVQTGDFEDSTFGGVVSGKPLLSQALRKFKRLDCNVDGFVPTPAANLISPM